MEKSKAKAIQNAVPDTAPAPQRSATYTRFFSCHNAPLLNVLVTDLLSEQPAADYAEDLLDVMDFLQQSKAFKKASKSVRDQKMLTLRNIMLTLLKADTLRLQSENPLYHHNLGDAVAKIPSFYPTLSSI